MTAAQAFHWFDPQRFANECRRILVPGGIAILAYNHRVADDPLTRDTFAINKKYCPAFKGFSGGMPDRAEYGLGTFYKDGQFTIREFRNEYSLDLEGFVGRALSSSNAPKPQSASYAAYTEEMTCVFDRFSQKGKVAAKLVCRVYWGEV